MTQLTIYDIASLLLQFYPGMGACGWHSSSSDYIFAISAHAWSGGNKCGKSARICHGSKCVTAKLVDECPGCSSGSLDLSPAAFKKLASLSTGQVNIKWHFT
ncbi:barwin-like endoglucanase [Microstroma glucosiphilum]|uniref:Barwin-like endoglucanase n=1 Tax=Pseudomicrostroma glucosiphilum TaxID=1684307 RepID=A0A316U824_9BASI|nr:barwin-like endoglucanase [Pseudomicrostroma glucosiphilum]PWN20611.1 barwin-like endoglucanase [Pseudomicrostroma glucosiphilum]